MKWWSSCQDSQPMLSQLLTSTGVIEVCAGTVSRVPGLKSSAANISS